MLIFPQPVIPPPQSSPALTQSIRTVFIAPMNSVRILGSTDARYGLVVGLQWAKPEKRLTFLGQRLYLVLEMNGSYTGGGGIAEYPKDHTFNAAFLGMARYERLGPSGEGTFIELGWGFHLANKVSADLDSRLNSTPTIGGGVVLRQGPRVYQIGARYYHISNAGTNVPNRGQNQIMLTLGLRF